MTQEYQDPNENCLMSVRCPVCGSTERFDIAVSAHAVVTDEGVESALDADWDDETSTVCLDCSHMAPMAEFTVQDPTLPIACPRCPNEAQWTIVRDGLVLQVALKDGEEIGQLLDHAEAAYPAVEHSRVECGWCAARVLVPGFLTPLPYSAGDRFGTKCREASLGTGADCSAVADQDVDGVKWCAEHRDEQQAIQAEAQQLSQEEDRLAIESILGHPSMLGSRQKAAVLLRELADRGIVPEWLADARQSDE